MARTTVNGVGSATISINQFGGLNNRTQFSQISNNQSPRLLNLFPGKTLSLRNRGGSRIRTATPLAGSIPKFPVLYRTGVEYLLATQGTTMYRYNSGTNLYVGQTMTNALVTSDIGWAQFRDDNANEVLIVADGGSLKSYNGTAVANITPAGNDSTPLPPNTLGTINTQQGVTVHNNRLVIWRYDKDIIYHSKPGFFDYFPSTSFQRYVKENDTIVTCISFGSSLLVFMRNNIGVLFGDGYSTVPTSTDWSQDFLDATDGCFNKDSVRVVTFPDLHQEVFYQTPTGVSSVYNIDTKSLDNSTRMATRSLTDNKVDLQALGITLEQWASAASVYHDGRYWLTWLQGSTWKGLVFETRNQEWYPIEGINATDFYSQRDTNELFFVTNNGNLKQIDPNIAVDYTNFAATTSTPVKWEWYSKLLNPQFNGLKHLWDILIIESQQFTEPAGIDIEVNTIQNQFAEPKAVKNSIMIIGESIIGFATIANSNFTDIINNGDRIRVFCKGQYSQLKLSSDRGEPVELYDIRFEVRVQDPFPQ